MIMVLGKKVGYKQLEANLNKEWMRKGSIKIIDVPRDYYQVFFTTEEDYNNAFLEGPCMIADHYILVQRWMPFFLANNTVGRKLAVWICIPKLPIELFNDKFLWTLRSTLGGC